MVNQKRTAGYRSDPGKKPQPSGARLPFREVAVAALVALPAFLKRLADFRTQPIAFCQGTKLNRHRLSFRQTQPQNLFFRDGDLEVVANLPHRCDDQSSLPSLCKLADAHSTDKG